MNLFYSELKFYDMHIKDVIGSGTYGEVFKAEYKNKEYACKVTNKDEDDLHHPGTLREMSLLAALKEARHPNIVSPLGMEFNKHKSLIIHLEFCEINLKNHLHKKRKSGDHEWIISGIVTGLNFLHSIGICHRDLKTENILLNSENKEVKLCDFGLGRFATDSPSTVKIVSAPYRPPEILINKKYNEIDMYKVDSWSLGCVLYEIFYKRFLFTPYKSESKQYKNIIETISNESWIEKIYTTHNSPYCDIIRQCVVLDPTERISVKHISKNLDLKESEYEIKKEKFKAAFKQLSTNRWRGLLKKLENYADGKRVCRETINLAINYMVCYLNRYSLKVEYENLLYKTAYYLAVRINETIYPEVNSIYEKEYSMSDINDMEQELIKVCKGNMWMFAFKGENKYSP